MHAAERYFMPNSFCDLEFADGLPGLDQQHLIAFCLRCPIRSKLFPQAIDFHLKVEVSGLGTYKKESIVIWATGLDPSPWSVRFLYTD